MLVPGYPTDLAEITAAQARHLAAVVLKALERDPARRCESVAAFFDTLTALLELRPVAAKAPCPADRSWRWARRHPVTSATLALALVLSTGFGAFRVRRLQHEQARATRIADELRGVLKDFDHPDVAALLAHLGKVQRARGSLGESEQLLTEAVKRDRTAYTGVNL